jgi:hypothetical protein
MCACVHAGKDESLNSKSSLETVYVEFEAEMKMGSSSVLDLVHEWREIQVKGVRDREVCLGSQRIIAQRPLPSPTV